MTKKDLVLAVAAGVLAPCVGLAFASVIGLLIFPEPNKSFLGAAFVSLVALIYSVPAVLLYGLPLFLILRTFQIANIFTCALVALASIAFAALYPPIGATLGKLIAFSFFFLTSALGFWFFARRTISTTRRPNN